MGIVADGGTTRIYLSPNVEHETASAQIRPTREPTTEIPNTRYTTPVIYGMTTHADLFTQRQLVALTTFSDLVADARERIRSDLVPDLASSFFDALSYIDAITIYLSFVLSRMADRHSSLTRWDPNPTGYGPKIGNTFNRQALSMIWDYVEGNPFSESSGNLADAVDWICKVIERLPASPPGKVRQADAAEDSREENVVCSTDPPYYDNVPYADLSDFFYVWLRRPLAKQCPDLFGTLLVPKTRELVADPLRQGGRDASRRFFEEGMRHVFANIRVSAHPEVPTTVFYAFKQSEEDVKDQEIPEVEGVDRDGKSPSLRSSTGWETMLQGLLDAGMQVTGTWPIRTELSNRIRNLDSNALASSIVLVCRPRTADAGSASRRDFIANLRRDLPEALRNLQHGNIAPVDLAQASIGPGMAVFSRYAQVIEAEGKPMTIRTALQLINQALDEVLAEQEGEFDSDTRWAIAWFDQYGMEEGPFGTAETLSKAKNTSVAGLS
jgi:putative DNA methylase